MIPTTKECIRILQAKFVIQSSALPADILFTCLLPCTSQIRSSQWRNHHNTALVKTLPEPFDRLNASEFRQYSKLLPCCRPSLSLHLILCTLLSIVGLFGGAWVGFPVALLSHVYVVCTSPQSNVSSTVFACIPFYIYR
ncbi:MAG: hypothetical protein EXX96DRAFT_623483 [Benjaminiella poitrasii]|nr:MAG: hypothetical protein EXX96DRAFT_623483 [Benjaminiella poitrasii]